MLNNFCFHVWAYKSLFMTMLIFDILIMFEAVQKYGQYFMIPCLKCL